MKKKTVLIICLLMLSPLILSTTVTSFTVYDTLTFGGYANVTAADPGVFTIYDTLTFGGYADIAANNAPTFANEAPTNESTLISLTPHVYIVINDADSDTTTCDFYTSNDGSAWTWKQTNSTVSAGTNISYSYVGATSYNTKYYWKVTANDGVDNSSSNFYEFTTHVAPANSDTPIAFSNPSPVNNSGGQELSFTWTCTVNDNEGDYTDWHVQIASFTDSGSANDTVSIAVSGLAYNTSYNCISWGNDTNNVTHEVYNFITKAAPATGAFAAYDTLYFNGMSQVYGDSPFLTFEGPSNDSININLYPMLNITIVEPQGENFDIAWTSNASGTWSETNTTCTDGTFNQRATWANTSNTKYWFNISVNDSSGNWINETYHFTTRTTTYSAWCNWWVFNYITYNPPTSFVAETHNNSRINLSWTNHSNVTHTYIEKNTAASWNRGDGTEIYNDTGTSYNNTGLNLGTQYYYQAWGYNDSANLFTSVYTTANNKTSPGDPSYLHYTSKTMTTIDLEWNKGTNATRSIIIMNETGYAGYPTFIANGTEKINVTINSGTVSGLTANVTYYFSVWSFCSDSGVMYSENYTSVNETTLATADTPTNLNAITDDDVSIDITWAKGESDYTVIRSNIGSYPTITTGTEIYNDTGTSYDNTGLTPTTHYYYRAWGWNGVTHSTSYASDHDITYPSPPTNLIGNIDGTTLTITWTKGIGADRTLLRNASGSYPATYTDGNFVYNDTGELKVVSGITDIDYYRGWSYAVVDGTHLYSDGENLLWGGLEINVYKEADATVAIHNYTVFIKNSDGSETYENTSQNNPTRIDVNDVPNGAGIAVKISRDGYHSRTQYMDLYENLYYNSTFYLVAVAGGDGGGDPSDDDYIPPADETQLETLIDTVTSYTVDMVILLNCSVSLDEIEMVYVYNDTGFGGWRNVAEDKYSVVGQTVTINATVLDKNSSMVKIEYYCDFDEETGSHYIIRVKNIVERAVEDAYVVIERYIDTTEAYETIYSLYTDGNGELTDLQLIPSVIYQVTISKSGYVTQLNDWTPPTIVYVEDTIKEFVLQLSDPDVDFKAFSDSCTFTASMNESGYITTCFTDSSSHVINTSIILYEVGNYTKTPVAWWNHTANISFCEYYQGNPGKEYQAYLYINHSDFSFLEQFRNVYSWIDPAYNETDIDEKFTNIFGDFELGWTKFLIIFLPCLILLVVFGSNHTGISVMGAGLWLLFSSYFVQVSSFTTFGGLASIVIFLGVALIAIKKGGRVT